MRQDAPPGCPHATAPPARRPDALAPRAPVGRATEIGEHLRQIFDEAAAEPIPDAFKDLLRKLG